MRRLADGARQIGLPLSPAVLRAFQTYRDELLEWNQRFNLTAVRDAEQVEIRHFLDSLTCLLALREIDGEQRDATAFSLLPGAAISALDVGSGAGFPGLPLKIVWPALRLTLLEATGKKAHFLEHIAARLGLTGVTIVNGRAEEVAHDPAHREAYDLVLARAVAELPELLEYTLPFARRGGWVLAPKGSAAHAEALAAETAMRRLGGHLHRLLSVEIPGLAETRCIVIVEKVAATPPEFPRRPGVPHKYPLR
ncbi:MAG: 16S rRNA (guanine(527)-N(7))-methyltransferase RsmG [Anaerolineae bacterium]|nr:16S rRNA (guanine(527)-N(7))-methyltransferase RsmG [Anaerolineae bacterium]